ncbi:MAG: redoxin domain-containing protein, partial [Cyclobacteriaceae bacterium]
MKKIVTIILTVWSLGTFAQTTSKIGNSSPNLVFEKIINFNQNKATLADFKGKVVVLDFWATWCSPCIKSLPELEALQTKYQSDLQVITITSDPAERIEKFLSKKALKLPVVIDEQGKLATVFPHRTIPHTIVIDKSGIVRAITSSSQITEEIINKVINGQEVNITEKKEVMDFDPSKPLSGNENFTYQITITPFQEGYPSFSNIHTGEGFYKNRRIYATNLGPKSLFEIAYQFPVSIRTIVEVKDFNKLKWNKDNAVCFELTVPDKLSEQRFEIMKQHLDLYFDYKAVTEERLRKVMVLRQLKDSPKIVLTKSSDKTEASASYSGKGLSMKNSLVSKLAEFLESQLDIPVVDDSNLIEKYDVEIAWYN